jgi:hypothetical protein
MTAMCRCIFDLVKLTICTRDLPSIICIGSLEPLHVEWSRHNRQPLPARPGYIQLAPVVLHVTCQMPQDVMLVRRKTSSLSAPNTPHASLPPTPLRALASPRIGLAGLATGGGGTAFPVAGIPAGVSAAGSLVAKLAASAATVSAASSAAAESESMSVQIFHVARLLRYKVYLLQQVSCSQRITRCTL